jgi:hypothetical protein
VQIAPAGSSGGFLTPSPPPEKATANGGLFGARLCTATSQRVQKIKLCAARVVVPKFLRRGIGLSAAFEALFCRLLKGSEPKVAPMSVSTPNVSEIKLDRLIDDMRLLRSQMIAFDRNLKGIEAYLKTTEPNEQQPQSKLRPWFAAAASATARTVLFAVGASTGAVLLYLGTWPDNGTAISALMSTPPSQQSH